MITWSLVCLCTALFAIHQDNPDLHYKQAWRIAKHTCSASRKYDVPYFLTLAVMSQETSFSHITKPSKTSDYGIMQLHCPEGSKSWLCTKCDIKRLRCNIYQGSKYLSRLLGDPDKISSSKELDSRLQGYNPGSPSYGKRVRQKAYSYIFHQYGYCSAASQPPAKKTPRQITIPTIP